EEEQASDRLAPRTRGELGDAVPARPLLGRGPVPEHAQPERRVDVLAVDEEVGLAGAAGDVGHGATLRSPGRARGPVPVAGTGPRRSRVTGSAVTSRHCCGF